MQIDVEKSSKKKSTPRKKGKGKVSFDEEIITKEHSSKLAAQEKVKTVKKKKKRPRDPIDSSQPQINEETNQAVEAPVKKKKPATEDTVEEATNNDPKKLAEKKLSNRSLKHKKHEQLLKHKKLKAELELQQRALNYLSKWKHSKSEWKFEKLRQVWLQENLFDSSKVPEEFWGAAVEYFSGAKGRARDSVLEQATKCIEEEEQQEDKSEQDLDEEMRVKLKRARDIIQFME